MEVSPPALPQKAEAWATTVLSSAVCLYICLHTFLPAAFPTLLQVKPLSKQGFQADHQGKLETTLTSLTQTRMILYFVLLLAQHTYICCGKHKYKPDRNPYTTANKPHSAASLLVIEVRETGFKKSTLKTKGNFLLSALCLLSEYFRVVW